MKLRLELTLCWMKPSCFSYVNDAFLILIDRNLHKKSSEVSTKRSTPASLSFKGQATKPHGKIVCHSLFCVFQKLPVSCFPDTHIASLTFFKNVLELKCKIFLNFIPSIDIVVLDKLFSFFFQGRAKRKIDELAHLLDVAKMNYRQLGGVLDEDQKKQEEERESARLEAKATWGGDGKVPH